MSFLLLLLKFIFALYVSKVFKMRKKETNEINILNSAFKKVIIFTGEHSLVSKWSPVPRQREPGCRQ